jgi:hypothetical protein
MCRLVSAYQRCGGKHCLNQQGVSGTLKTEAVDMLHQDVDNHELQASITDNTTQEHKILCRTNAEFQKMHCCLYGCETRQVRSWRCNRLKVFGNGNEDISN